jgi:hypothetical protein
MRDPVTARRSTEAHVKRTAAFLAIFLLLGLGLSAEQPGSFSLTVGLGNTFPVPPSSSSFGLLGVQGSAELGYRFTDVPFLYALSGLAYRELSLSSGGLPVRTLDLTAGIGARWDVLPWLGLKADVSGGYYYGWLEGSSPLVTAGNPNLLVRAGADAQFGILLLELMARYDNLFGTYHGSGLALTAGIQLGGAPPASRSVTPPPQKAEPAKPQPKPLEEKPKPVVPPKPAPAKVELAEISFPPVFPVFYKYYDDHPFGTLQLRNNTKSAISEVKVSAWVRQYMDGPKEAEGPKGVAPGESAEVKLFAIFTNRILDINEATKVQAEIELTYTQDGKPQKQTVMQTIRVLDRNAMTWDDDRRAAAFVSSKDPSVLSFSKRVVNLVSKSANRSLNQNLQTAIGIHEALTLFGLGYVKDPKSASIGSGAVKEQADFLQFPRQTLEFKGGDCDDLTILYASLFEAVGIDTAFITCPGHIYMAFNAGVTAAEARKSFSRVDDLIIKGDAVWIPIEVTDRSDFFTSWQAGAKEWRENSARGQASLYGVHDAWSLYEPAGLSGSGPSAAFPEEARLKGVFVDLRDSYIEREISSRVAALQAQVKKTQESPKAVNALGVLYARYGLMDKAKAQFEKVTKKEEYVPSLLNLGTISYSRGDRDGALVLFERARAKEPENAPVLLALARVNHDVENYYAVKKYYADLKRIDPGLAEQFAYLDLKGEEAARAADISGAREVMLWSE